MEASRRRPGSVRRRGAKWRRYEGVEVVGRWEECTLVRARGVLLFVMQCIGDVVCEYSGCLESGEGSPG